jgi:ribonuclease VapC
VSNRLYVLDASALLALMLGEDGAAKVHDVLSEARISTVNLSEVTSKLQDKGVPQDVILQSLAELDLDIIPFGHDHATRAGLLRRVTKAAGLSLSDRACLATAASMNAVAVTADRHWSAVADAAETELLLIR